MKSNSKNLYEVALKLSADQIVVENAMNNHSLNGLVVEALDDKDIQKLKNKLPLKRLGTTAEIGELVKNIVLKDIKYINGTTIFMDGGKSKTLF